MNLAFYLFANHHMKPSDVFKMGHGEKTILRAFVDEAIRLYEEARKQNE